MELEVQQPPQSPRTVQLFQEPTKATLDPEYYAIQQAARDTIKQLSEQRKTEHSEAIISALSNHREEINERIDRSINEHYTLLKTDIKSLNDRLAIYQNYNTQIAEKIALLSQKNDSLNSEVTFFKYCAMASFLALIIGAVASSAKIMDVCNHIINQAIKA